MIQIPYLSDVQSAVRSNAAFQQPDDVSSGGRGLEELGQTIGAVGQNLFDHGIAIQRIENERQVQELQLKMEEAQAQFQNSIINDFEPETWQSRYKQTIDGVLAGSNAGSLAPEAKAKFEGWKNEFVSKNTLAIQRDAKVQMIKRAEISEQTTVDKLVALGKYDEAADIISNSAIRSPEEKDASLFRITDHRKKEAKQLIASELNLKMQENPYFDPTPEMEESGEFSEVEINNFKLKRNQTVKRVESDLVEDVTKKFIDGVYLTEEDALKEHAGLPPEKQHLIIDAKKRVDNYRHAEAKHENLLHGEAIQLIEKLQTIDKSSPDNHSEYASTIGEITGKLEAIKNPEIKATIKTRLSLAKENQSTKTSSETLINNVMDNIYPETTLNAKPPESKMSFNKALLDGALMNTERLSAFGLQPFEGEVTGEDAFEKQQKHIQEQYLAIPAGERSERMEQMKQQDPQLYAIMNAAVSGYGKTSDISWMEEKEIQLYNAKREKGFEERAILFNKVQQFRNQNPTADEGKVMAFVDQEIRNVKLKQYREKNEEQDNISPKNKPQNLNTKNLLSFTQSRNILESDDQYKNARTSVLNTLQTHYKDAKLSEQQKLALTLYEIRRGKGAVERLTGKGTKTLVEIQKDIFLGRNAGDYYDLKLATEEYWLFKDTEELPVTPNYGF